jgi:glycosyltransferase involved in cell wall biosynthesis
MDASTEPRVRSSSLPFPASAASVVPADENLTRSYGLLSTFPPTACGIATFSAALAAGLVAHGASVDVVRCGVDGGMEDPLVSGTLDDAGPDRFDGALDVLDGCDVAIVQHEYGIYGGADGDDVLTVLEALAVPAIVVAHTVLRHPTWHQRQVLEAVCDNADAVVVMTETARTRLIEHFDVDATKIEVIPHGATTPGSAGTSDAGRRDPRRPARVLTWGLLGPGKGIEWAIDAMASMSDLRPRPSYVVAGATHPKVLERDGESYRRMLVERSSRMGAAPWVTFDDAYRDLQQLDHLIRSADVVVLPYDSEEQVTSGVLVDAVAAGRPVVSTAFPHAVELLATGAGVVVPQRDPIALAQAIRAVVTDVELAGSMAAEARRLAPGLSWNAIAARYDRLADSLSIAAAAQT